MRPSRRLRLRDTDPEAVLSLDPTGVRWTSLRGGGEYVGESAVEGSGPAAIAAAAVRARTAARDRSRACVLALSPTLVPQRFLALPRLSRKDMLGVLERKAAGMLGDADGDELVCARRAGELLAETTGRTDGRWIVAATRRSLVRELQHALRASGIHVARVVSAQLAGPALVLARGGDVAAVIVVALERRHTIVSLISENQLLNQNVLEGGFDTTPTMALTLLQEIKGYDAVHRKHRRGEPVTRVVVLGAQPERGELLSSSIRAALPQARCEMGLAAPLDAPQAPARGAALEIARACRERSPLQAEFSLPLAPRPLAVAAVALASLALVGAAGVVTWSGAHVEELRLRDATRAIEGEVADLDRLLAQNVATRAKLAELDALRVRNAAVLASGWPLERVLESAFRACGSDAAIVSLKLDRPAEAALFEIEAVTAPRPLDALRCVTRIERALASDPSFTAVAALPAGTPGVGEGPFTFVVRGAGRLP